jgi:Fic family protein
MPPVQPTLFSEYPIMQSQEKKYPVSEFKDVTARKHKGNPQSKKANIVAAPHKNTKRKLVHLWFQHNGPAITEDFILGNPDWHYPTVTARISELKRDGFLEEIGERPTKYSNSPAAILRVTDKPYPE